MIAEGHILLGVEDLQQRRCRVAAKIRAQLIDFIEHENRIARAGSPDILDDLAWQRPDVGSPVAANFGFVAHTAKRDADELPSHRFRNRTAQRSLPDSRRTDEAQNGGLALRLQLQHGKVFENAFFDLFEIVVVAVEDFAGFHDVDFLGGENTPGQRDKPVEIRSCNRVFGRRG